MKLIKNFVKKIPRVTEQDYGLFRNKLLDGQIKRLKTKLSVFMHTQCFSTRLE